MTTRAALAALVALALAGCNPCKAAQRKLCTGGSDDPIACSSLKTLVEAGSDDASCQQLLDAARARDSKQEGADIAFTTATAAVTAAAVRLELNKAGDAIRNAFGSGMTDGGKK